MSPPSLSTPAVPPAVTIVTPVLNRVDTIGDVLVSVAAQTHRPLEHVVIDGGSTDGTVDTIESFARSSDVPIRWISEPDTGMYDAINKGFRMARGDVLAYLNSDDLYFPWSVETAIAELRKGCDFVFGDVAIITRRGAGTLFRVQFYRRFDPTYYIQHAILAQPTVFWSRRAMEQIGPFNEDLQYLGDVEYWARAGVAGLRFCHVDEVLALTVEHPQTLSAQFADGVGKELAAIRTSFVDRSRPPRRRRSQRARESLSWRWRQLVFRREARRAEPRRWPRFIGSLRRLGIEIGGNGLLVMLLPDRMLQGRPRLRMWLEDPEEFERLFLKEIRTRTEMGESRGR